MISLYSLPDLPARLPVEELDAEAGQEAGAVHDKGDDGHVGALQLQALLGKELPHK